MAADEDEDEAGAGGGSSPDVARAGSSVGVVAIGRNEGARLSDCLLSARDAGHAVYVDSGSSDGSVALARGLGFEVVELAPDRPYTPARARNAGVERLRAAAPGLDYVMFLDGDCTLSEGWLARAAAELDRNPGVAVVCGRRREARPGRSVFHRLMDVEWDGPVGDVRSCGGDAAVRVRAFLEAGGFEPGLPAGEEPELCHRLLGRGWRVVRIPAEMTAHDLGEATLGSWWRRNVRHGYTSADVSRRFPGPAGPYRRFLVSAWAWGVAAPTAITAVAVCGPAVAGLPGMACGLLAALLYPAQVLRLAWGVRPRVADTATALAHGLATLAAKWAHLAGQLVYLRDVAAGRSPRFLEYRPSRMVDPS
jgi:GT2 family glycosyltransferase